MARRGLGSGRRACSRERSYWGVRAPVLRWTLASAGEGRPRPICLIGVLAVPASNHADCASTGGRCALAVRRPTESAARRCRAAGLSGSRILDPLGRCAGGSEPWSHSLPTTSPRFERSPAGHHRGLPRTMGRPLPSRQRGRISTERQAATFGAPMLRSAPTGSERATGSDRHRGAVVLAMTTSPRSRLG
jgi:hypothetical protein